MLVLAMEFSRGTLRMDGAPFTCETQGCATMRAGGRQLSAGHRGGGHASPRHPKGGAKGRSLKTE
jgi:hypothetical protein